MGKYKQRKDGRYATTISLGGKQYTVYGKTIKEVDKKRANMINDYELGLLLKSKDATFKDYKWEQFKTKEPLISAKSAQSYKSILNNHFTEIDYKKIADIKKTDIQRLINTLIDKPNTANKVYMTLNQILENAVDDNIINKNPCRRIIKPKTETKKQKNNFNG